MFSGLSSLRKEEEKKTSTELTEKQKAMQAYLSKYTGGSGGGGADGEKKKKKKKRIDGPSNITVIDADATGFKKEGDASKLSYAIAPPAARPMFGQLEEEEEEDADLEGAVIMNRDQYASDLMEGRKVVRSSGAGPAASLGKFRESAPAAAAPAPAAPRRRHDSDAEDMSPPRRPAPPRARHDSDAEDLSPPRRPAPGPARPSDLSPPRRRARHDSDAEDISPPRRPAPAPAAQASGPDLSPPRRRARHDSDSEPDLSPPRRSGPTHLETLGKNDGDLDDLPRKNCATAAAAGAADLPAGTATGAPSRTIMADGTRVGIISGAELSAQLELKKKAERERFLAMGREETGRGSATVYRDLKTGNKLSSKEEFLESRGKGPKKDDRFRPEWAGGLAQIRRAEERQKAIAHEASKSFHRGYDDDLDTDRKRKSRWGDPMAELAAKKAIGKSLGIVDEGAGLPASALEKLDKRTRKRLKKAGFIIPEGIPEHSWIKRRLAPAPNRFDITPGRWWDGVDRSNGFEKNFFKQMNEKAQRDAERFAWDNSDL